MEPVDSSDLACVGYENGTMHISFQNGGLYAYYNVPMSIHRELMNAPSHGRYFHTYIKGKYRATRIS
ncbi:MAG: KTSC domain-containing protein [Holosporales bacterium]|nr:KTSC domain-containing protein [Holosporales bacterium]